MNHKRLCQDRCVIAAAAWIIVCSSSLQAGDWPMFGLDRTRNPVSSEKNPPLDWQVASPKDKTERNVLWSARLGSNTMGDPVISDGLVWVGTNEYTNVTNRTDAAVLLCVNAKTGKPLYRYISPRLHSRYLDWPYSSLGCSPLIEGNLLWFTTNRGEVICLDISPLKEGGGKPKQLWKVDMIKEFAVVLRGADMGVMHIPSIASHDKYLYVVTGQGIDVQADRVTAPTAPSLVCLEKATGKLVWKDATPGANIIEGQWSSPTICQLKDQTQVVVARGDGWIRAFDPKGDGNGGSRVIWEFDINPKTSRFIFRHHCERRYFAGTPVFHGGRIYIGSGVNPALGRPSGRFVCIDPTKRGDISEQLAVDAQGKKIPHRRLQAVDPSKGEEAIENANSGKLWAFEPNKEDYEKGFNGTISRVAVHDGLVIASDMDGFLHCLDADTGKRYWTHDFLAANFASPLIIDGKVYVADEDGDVTIFALSKTKKQIAEVAMPDPIYCSPVFANGVLYLATRSRLYAIAGNGKPVAGKNETSKPDSRPTKAALAGIGESEFAKRSVNLQIGLVVELLKSGNHSDRAAKLAAQLLPHARRAATSEDTSAAQRADAVALLALDEPRRAQDVLMSLLDTRQPRNVQLAAVRTLAKFTERDIAKRMIDKWSSTTPVTRTEIVETILTRRDWIEEFFNAFEAKTISPGEISLTRRDRLLNHDDEPIRRRAAALLSEEALGTRKDVIAAYQPVLTLTGNEDRGKRVFLLECIACHRFGKQGHDAGPNLSDYGRKRLPPQSLMAQILDPNREVSSNFISYTVVLADGRIVNGLIATQTPSSITLKRDQNVTVTILRKDIDEIKSSGKSLMPEGLEKKINHQDMADLLEFLSAVNQRI